MGVPAVVRQSALLDSAFANRSADYPIRPHRLVPATNEPGISAGTEPKGFAATGSRPAPAEWGGGVCATSRITREGLADHLRGFRTFDYPVN